MFKATLAICKAQIIELAITTGALCTDTFNKAVAATKSGLKAGADIDAMCQSIWDNDGKPAPSKLLAGDLRRDIWLSLLPAYPVLVQYALLAGDAICKSREIIDAPMKRDNTGLKRQSLKKWQDDIGGMVRYRADQYARWSYDVHGIKENVVPLFNQETGEVLKTSSGKVRTRGNGRMVKAETAEKNLAKIVEQYGAVKVTGDKKGADEREDESPAHVVQEALAAFMKVDVTQYVAQAQKDVAVIHNHAQAILELLPHIDVQCKTTD